MVCLGRREIRGEMQNQSPYQDPKEVPAWQVFLDYRVAMVNQEETDNMANQVDLRNSPPKTTYITSDYPSEQNITVLYRHRKKRWAWLRRREWIRWIKWTTRITWQQRCPWSSRFGWPDRSSGINWTQWIAWFPWWSYS